MKSIIFLLFVCTFFCVAHAAPDPADFQTLNKLESLLRDKIRTDKQSMEPEPEPEPKSESMDTKAIAEGIDQAAIESLIEKARAQAFFKKLRPTLENYSGKWIMAASCK